MSSKHLYPVSLSDAPQGCQPKNICLMTICKLFCCKPRLPTSKWPGPAHMMNCTSRCCTPWDNTSGAMSPPQAAHHTCTWVGAPQPYYTKHTCVPPPTALCMGEQALPCATAPHAQGWVGTPFIAPAWSSAQQLSDFLVAPQNTGAPGHR